jgi:hypothetical protein
MSDGCFVAGVVVTIDKARGWFLSEIDKKGAQAMKWMDSSSCKAGEESVT